MRRSLFTLLIVGALAAVAVLPAGATPHGDKPDGPAPSAGTEAAIPEAAPVSGLTQVSAGYDVTCARTSDGRARCWGENDEGQLGQGNFAPRQFSVIVRNPAGTGPLTGVRQVATTDDGACALLTNQEVRCWGDNEYGAVGDGTDTNDRPLPRIVKGVGGTGRLDNIVEISGESDGMCARTAGGQVRCWGEDDYGQLGDGDVEADSNTPRIVRGVGGTGRLTGVVEIEAAYDNNCARLANGQARCWGYNDGGELGNGGTAQSGVPTVVSNRAGTGPLTGVRDLSHGGYGGCAALTNGQVRCWGVNDTGQVGDGTTSERLRPVPVRSVSGGGVLTGAVAVTGGYYHSCALLNTGQVRCWGETDNGELGDGTSFMGPDRLRPRVVKNLAGNGPLTGVRSINANQSHTCAIVAQGQARCWGRNDYGQLGNGGTVDRNLPVRVLA